MIGYNVAKIQDLMDDVAATYNSMADMVGTRWKLLESTMQKEWIGPDEVAMQNEIAGRLIQLHKDCRVTVEQIVKNVCEIEKGWREFQGKNKVQGGNYAVEIDKIKELEPPKIAESNIEELVKADVSLNFADSVNLGLTNGEQSAGKIKMEADDFSKAVYNKAHTLYNQLDSSQAFLGGGQSQAIKNYLMQIGESLGKFLSNFKDLYEALDILANQNYADSATQVGTDLKESSIEIDSSNSVYKG